ncbi:MAG: hypothetical protein KDD25_09160 [Bdellovibrionales bacterium]|nr:hypothetical protein [Bdellovibrionales bacterium]
MKFSKLLLVGALALSVSGIAKADLASDKEELFSRLQAESANLQDLSAKMEQARKSFAQTFLDIAVWAVQAREAKQVCELEAYANLPVSGFVQALQIDQEGALERLAEEPALAKELTKNLYVNLLLQNSDSEDIVEVLNAALVGVEFYGPARGVYGNEYVLNFQADGEVEVKKLVVNDDGASTISVFGTFKVVLEEGKPPLLSLTLNNDEEIKMYLLQSQSGQFILSVQPDGEPATERALPFPSECEA